MNKFEMLWESIGQEIDGFELREQQKTLSEKIYNSINLQKNLIAEGPCGVGKSLAYLVAFLASKNAKAVICTANNSLLSQLYSKDMPMIERAANRVGIDASWTMVQGKTNYMCTKRWSKVRDNLVFNASKETLDTMDYIDNMDDKEEHWLGHIQDDKKFEWIKNNLTIPRNKCGGGDCEYAGSCEMIKSRNEAKQARITITNYHLWIADTVSRSQGDDEFAIPILGHYDTLIFDESHELPSIARDCFKLEMTSKSMSSYAKMASPERSSQLSKAWNAYLKAFRNAESKNGYIKTFPCSSIVAKNLSESLLAVAKEISRKKSKSDSHHRALDSMKSMLENYALTGSVSETTHAYGYSQRDGGERGLKNEIIECLQINPGKILSRLYPVGIPKIFVSATLATGKNDFKFMKSQLGIEDEGFHEAYDLQVSSPFDFSKSLTISMNDSPDPNQDPLLWIEYCADVLETMIQELEGRVLGLFTSTARMNKVWEELNRRPSMRDHIVLCQGTGSNNYLSKRFREEKNTSLLGVSSFWTGVDVKGDSLSAVFIERTPFPTPGDLVSNAMSEKIGYKAFFTHSLPNAMIKLRQGAGRLIRSQSDKGIVVFADGRVNKKKYGKRVLACLLDGGRDENRSRIMMSDKKQLKDVAKRLKNSKK